jgi:3-oxoacyl-[acyl-carrier-protein] synthase II
VADNRRVVVTGVGAVTPVGNTADDTWRNLLAGKSGVARITLFDPSEFAVQVAGEVKYFDPGEAIDPKELRHMDRSVQFAIVATKQALQDAKLDITEEEADNTGIIFGSAAGGVGTILTAQQVLEERGPRRVSPFFLPNFLADSASGQVAIAVGAKGPNMAVVSACATGGHAVGEAMETIKRGDADVMIAGGTEAVIVPVILAGFINMRALGDDPDDPTKASKPFDARRKGFVLSEGSAVLILEELDHARKRGAHIYAEVVGYGSTNDAYDMAAQLESGEGAARTMQRALRRAVLKPSDIDYINAHGTGTPLNDRVETLAIKTVFGDDAYKVAISSTKSMTGHMMGAAGALESMVCALAIRDSCIPPTINLEEPDPECDLDYTPLKARSLKVNAALSNSIGLGGHNSTVILKRFED